VAHIPGTLFFHIDGIVHWTTDVRNVSEYICKIHESEFHRFDGQVVYKGGIQERHLSLIGIDASEGWGISMKILVIELKSAG
jgi:hypothetical protein